MEPSEQRTFPARMAMLAETATFVETFCARAGVSRDDALRLTLIVEELFTNTVAHGHGGDCDAPVAVALAAREDALLLYFEDCAPAFDPGPRMAAGPAALEAPLEARPVGGLGMHLVARLAHHVRYAYEDGRNRLWIELRRSPQEGR